MTTALDISARAELHWVARETRNLAFREVEIREKPDGSGGTTVEFNGYASVTETAYEMHDMFGPYTEIVRRGAFTKTIADGCDTAFLINHDGLTMARTKSGTLRLAEDSIGLHANADLDAARADVQALRSGINRDDIDEMSFAFRTIRQEWSPDYDQRDLIELSLDKGDVSAVNYGANPHTSGPGVSLRSLINLSADERSETEWRSILGALEGLGSDEALTRLAHERFSLAELAFFAEWERALGASVPCGPTDLHLARAHALRLRGAKK